MIGLIGYNFCGDVNALDPSPTGITNIQRTKISSGVVNHFNLSSNGSMDFDDTIPASWNFSTIINAGFNGNLNGGSLAEIGSQITSVRVKRREKGAFEWITLYETVINTLDDLSFSYIDRLNINFKEYEYAFVPVMESVEGNYITNDVVSNFKGIYICDANTIYKFKYGVAYNSNDRVQQVGVFTPFGRRMPVVVSNGLLNYETGNISGKIINKSFEKTGKIDRNAIQQEKTALLDYLTNKEPKIIKDWNGNAWLVYITGNPSVTYSNEYGMGIMDVSADWTEIGSMNSKSDLYDANMIPTED